MTLILISVAFIVGVSAMCGLAEAALYAVSGSYVRGLAERGSAAGRLLSEFKANMERPISAVLILNTVSNTAGAAIAGAQAQKLWGETSLVWFSTMLTLMILFGAEIIPKVLGVSYNRSVARIICHPVNWMILALYPLIKISTLISQVLTRGRNVPAAPEEEVRQLAAISAEEGSITPYEAELVRNVLKLNDLKAWDILTPRPVVLAVAADTKVGELATEAPKWAYARVPIHSPDDPEDWTGMVFRREVLSRLAADQFDTPLSAISQPLQFVPDTTPGHKLLSQFIQRRTHLFGVVDEYGAIVGIVTLEDVMESLIGAEIVDETDRDVDLQETARRRKAIREKVRNRQADDRSR